MKKPLPLLNFSPWSPSKADLAAQCGLAFKYRYVDRLKGLTKGSPAKVGTTVHRAQELLLKGEKIGHALDTAITESEDELTSVEQEQVRSFAQAVINFNDRMSAFFDHYPAEEVFLENKWAITTDFKPCEWFDNSGMIRGIVDMGVLLKNGYLVIIDHKTGRPRPLEYYGSQLDIYAVMAEAHFPKIKGVQCALHYLKNEQIVWAKPKSVAHIRKVLRPWLMNYLNVRAEGLTNFPPKMSFLCKWCDFREVCPQVQNEQNGDHDSSSLE